MSYWCDDTPPPKATGSPATPAMTSAGPELQPLVACPNDRLGDESDVRWLMMTAVAHRVRRQRVTYAMRVLEMADDPLVSAEQRAFMKAIVRGTGDLMLMKMGTTQCGQTSDTVLAHGIEKHGWTADFAAFPTLLMDHEQEHVAGEFDHDHQDEE